MQPNSVKILNNISAAFFNGKISQKQTQGTSEILNYWDENGYYDGRHLAYILATVYHETARTMQPIEEYGKGKGHSYGNKHTNGKVYYGRGFVQLTWAYNYEVMGNKLGVNLLENPELALDMHIAKKILFIGMHDGMFTGKSLHFYFNDEKTDALNARRIINGMDKAELIAGYYDKFMNCIFSKPIKN